MKNFLKIFSVIGIATLAVVGIVQAVTTLPIYTPNTFETYLANQQATTDTTATLASGTLRDSTALTGYQCFVIDVNTPSQEYECGTVSGTTVSNIVRGLDSVAATSTVSTLIFFHRRGADVQVTDYPVITYLNRLGAGIDQYPNILHYSTTTATSSLANADIPDVAWVLSQTGAITSVSNSDGTLTISPTTGNVVASLNLNHSNTFTSLNTFTSGIVASASSTIGNGTRGGGLTINGDSTTTNATTTNFFATFASTTDVRIGAKLGIGTSTPNNALTIGNNGSIAVGENRLATSTSMTLDWTKGNAQLMQIGTAAISVTQSNYIAGQHLLVNVCNPASGTAGTITWNGVEWAGGTAPVQTTTVNVCDVWSFIATQASSTTGTLKIFGTAATSFN